MRPLVLSAKGLMAKDRSSSDPFVVIKLGGQTHKTHVVFKNLSPTWNYSCDFIITPALVDARIQFDCWDKDLIGRDFLGHLSIAVNEVLFTALEDPKNVPSWHMLLPRSPKEKVSGEIQLKCGYVGELSHDLKQLQMFAANVVKPAFQELYSPYAETIEESPLWAEDIQDKGPKENEFPCLERESIHIIDYEKSEVGSVELKISDLVSKCPAVVLNENEPMHPDANQLTVRLFKGGKPIPSMNPSTLNIRVSFFPYSILRRNYFIYLLKNFDSNNDGCVNQVELTTMLDSIGSTLSDDSITRLFLDEQTLKVTPEISLEAAASAFENRIARDADFHKSPYPGSPTRRSLETTAFRRQYQDEQVIEINSCPICKKKVRQKKDIDVVSHVASKQMIEEVMPVYVRLGVRLLFQAAGNKSALKQGEKFEHPSSKEEIRRFIAFHNISVDEILLPLSQFANFNEFFYRQLKPNVRPPAEKSLNFLLSPADARVCCFPKVSAATQFWIKGAKFNLQGLLSDEKLIRSIHKVEGSYFTLASVAVRSAVNVFAENNRVIILIDTPPVGSGHGAFGTVAMICIDAELMRARIEIRELKRKLAQTKNDGERRIVDLEKKNQMLEIVQEESKAKLKKSDSNVTVLYEKAKSLQQQLTEAKAESKKKEARELRFFQLIHAQDELQERLTKLERENYELKEQNSQAFEENEDYASQLEHDNKQTDIKIRSLKNEIDILSRKLQEEMLGKKRLADQLSQAKLELQQKSSEVLDSSVKKDYELLSKQLIEQTAYTRKLESSNRELKREVDYLRQSRENVERLKEEKASLEKQLADYTKLREKAGSLETEVSRLNAEKKKWTEFLEKEDPTGFDSPYALSKSLAKERFELALLKEKTGAANAYQKGMQAFIQELENEVIASI
ncbi:hypothetical protein HDU96_009817 [Phlyctochytrium bullatum]|nr:hypothetical protein HDU96_009817 [Phlyctochytrium bullatum]